MGHPGANSPYEDYKFLGKQRTAHDNHPRLGSGFGALKEGGLRNGWIDPGDIARVVQAVIVSGEGGPALPVRLLPDV